MDIKDKCDNISLKIFIVGSSQINLSLSTLKNQYVTLIGYTEGSTVLLDFVENPLSLDISNLGITLYNSSLSNQSELVITMESLYLSCLRGVSLLNSNPYWTIYCDDIKTDFGSFSYFKHVNVGSKLSIIEGNPISTLYPIVNYSPNSQLIIDAFFTEVKISEGELLIGIGNNKYINVYGAPITHFSDHQMLNISGSYQDSSIKSNQILPKLLISMINNSYLSFSGSYPNNGGDTFSFSSKGLCSLRLSSPAPLQYVNGSKIQIGYVTANHVDFKKILDSDLSISTEVEGPIHSIVFTDTGIALSNSKDETISVPIASNHYGIVEIINENKEESLNIEINAPNATSMILPPVFIVLTERSKTFISKSFSHPNISNKLTIQTNSTNVEVKIADVLSSRNVKIVGSDGNDIPLEFLTIHSEPTITTSNQINSQFPLVLVLLGFISLLFGSIYYASMFKKPQISDYSA